MFFQVFEIMIFVFQVFYVLEQVIRWSTRSSRCQSYKASTDGGWGAQIPAIKHVQKVVEVPLVKLYSQEVWPSTSLTALTSMSSVQKE